MSEEKKLILRMLKDGKINEEEALKLLEAVKEDVKDEKSSNERFKINEEKVESSVNSFIGKIMTGIQTALEKAENAIVESEFNFGNISFEYTNFKGQKEEKILITELSEAIDLFINNNDGKIEVISWDENYIECIAITNYNENILSGEENFVLKNHNDNKHYLKINDEINNKHFSTKIKVFIPNQSVNKICIQNVNGKIRVNNLDLNSIDIMTNNSKIEVNKTKSSIINAKTSNGKIIIKDIESKELNLRTSNGKILLDNIDSKNIEAKNSNGSIQLDSPINSEYINLTSSNGGIYLDNLSFDLPTKLVLEGRNDDSLPEEFTNIQRDGNTVKAYTKDYTENSDSYQKIILKTSNGLISIL